MAFLFVTPHTSGNLSSQTWAAASSLLPQVTSSALKVGLLPQSLLLACVLGVQGSRTTPRPEGLPHAARSGLSELSLSLACLLACLGCEPSLLALLC